MIIEVDASKEIEGGKFFPVAEWKGGRWVGLTKVQIGRCPACARKCQSWMVDPGSLTVGCPDCALSPKDWREWKRARMDQDVVALEDLERITRILLGRGKNGVKKPL